MGKSLMAILLACLFTLSACSGKSNVGEESSQELKNTQEDLEVPSNVEEESLQDVKNELLPPTITNYTYERINDGYYVAQGVVTLDFNYDNMTMPENGEIYHTLVVVYENSDGDAYEHCLASYPIKYSELIYEISEGVGNSLTGEMYIYPDIINGDTMVWRGEKSESVFLK